MPCASGRSLTVPPVPPTSLSLFSPPRLVPPPAGRRGTRGVRGHIQGHASARVEGEEARTHEGGQGREGERQRKEEVVQEGISLVL